MKKILVPVDFSDCSNNAVEAALMLAGTFGFELFLLNVVEIPIIEYNYGMAGDLTGAPGTGSMDPAIFQSVMESSKERMQKLISSDSFKSIKVTSLVESGVVSQTVKGVCEKYAIDLIIMGTHGTSGLSGVLIGSNAEGIVKLSSIPVITIKNKIPHLPEIIVFASDFTEETNSFFPKVRYFAELFNAEIHFLFVNTIESYETTRSIKERVGAFFKKNNMEYPVTIYNDFTKEEGILHFSEDIGADLIALGTHGKHGLGRLFSGSISEDVVNHSSFPVLTINSSDKKK